MKEAVLVKIRELFLDSQVARPDDRLSHVVGENERSGGPELAVGPDFLQGAFDSTHDIEKGLINIWPGCDRFACLAAQPGASRMAGHASRTGVG